MSRKIIDYFLSHFLFFLRAILFEGVFIISPMKNEMTNFMGQGKKLPLNRNITSINKNKCTKVGTAST